MHKKISSFFNSPLSLLFFGFLGTTVFGSFINSEYHEKAWKSNAKFEMFKEQLQEAKDLEQKILTISNERYTLLERVHIRLASNQLEEARIVWKEYYKIVKIWNNGVKANKNRLALLFGDKIAMIFLNDTDNQSSTPNSLHHKFRIAHYLVLETLNCMKNNCKKGSKRARIDKARIALNELGIALDSFSQDLRQSLILKQKQLLQ